MKTKIILIIIICLIKIVSSYSYETHYNSTNDEKKDFSKESNPYLIFGVPPWTKYQDIQKRFNKITTKMRQRNLINSKQYQRYKVAFEEIEQIYKKNNYKDKSFSDVVQTTIINIFFYEFAIFAILIVSWTIYTFNTFAALLVATSVSVDNLIPHWFSRAMYQYIFSFILTLVIYFRSYIFYGTKNEEQKDEVVNNNVSGRRIRRRFEKIE